MNQTSELDGMVSAYDDVHTLDNQLMHEWYPKRVVEASHGESFLELGLGHGHSASIFASRFSRYKVVEASPEMIRRFRNRFGLLEMEIEVAYFEAFETDERFDHIGMGFVLEHVDDPLAILQRFLSFLKPGGTLFAAVPNCESLHRRIGHAAGLLPDMTVLSEGDRRFGHKRYFSLPSFELLLVAAGCEVMSAEGLMLKPVTTAQLEALNLSPAVLQGLMQVGMGYPELCNAFLVQARPAAVPKR